MPPTLAGHAGEVGGLAFTPDGQTVLSGGQDRVIRAWDAASATSNGCTPRPALATARGTPLA